MTYKRLLIIALLSGTWSNSAYAVDIIPELGISYRSFNYTINDKKYVEDTFPAIKFGITAVEDKFYANIYGENSLLTGEKTTVHPGQNEELATLKRKDASLSLGYIYSPNISFFGGYKWGKTQIDTEREDAKTDGNENYILVDTVNREHKAHGPFIGASYAIKLDKINIGWSLAYSKFDASLKSFNLKSVNPNSDDSKDISYDGDGYSASASLSGQLIKNLRYTMQLEAQHYKYDKFDNTAKIKENQKSVKISLKYLF